MNFYVHFWESFKNIEKFQQVFSDAYSRRFQKLNMLSKQYTEKEIKKAKLVELLYKKNNLLLFFLKKIIFQKKFHNSWFWLSSDGEMHRIKSAFAFS